MQAMQKQLSENAFTMTKLKTIKHSLNSHKAYTTFVKIAFCNNYYYL